MNKQGGVFFQKETLSHQFSLKEINQASDLLKQNAVSIQVYDESEEWFNCFDVIAKVHERFNTYRVCLALFEPDDEDPHEFPYALEARCNCYQRTEYCIHTIAVLLKLEALIQQGLQPGEIELMSWMDSVQQESLSDKIQPEVDSSYELFYELIAPSQFENPIKIKPQLYRRLKKGGLGSSKHWNQRDFSNPHLTAENIESILALQNASSLAHGSRDYYNDHYHLVGSFGRAVFEKIIATGRLHIADKNDAILSLGKTFDLSFKWVETADQRQSLMFVLPYKGATMFYLDGLWYLNKKNKTVGRINTTLTQPALLKLFYMPSMPSSQLVKMSRVLALKPEFESLPPPINVLPTEGLKTVELTPHLYCRSIELNDNDIISVHPTVFLSFQYGDQLIPWHDESVMLVKNGQTITARQIEKESAAIKELTKYGLRLLQQTPLAAKNPAFMYHHLFIEQDPFYFWENILPLLQAQGWIIQVDEGYEHRLIQEEAQEWYANVADTASDWFSFELGVLVNGEKINLLPIIQKLLQDLKHSDELSSLKEKTFSAKLPNKHFIRIPGERLHAIMQSFIELFDNKSLDDDKLMLSKSEAMRLLEVEKALGAAQLRWLSAHRMQALAKKIASFKRIKSVPVPKGLQAELRPYQQEGLDWLQFLREYELAGILADDMGLGKTIQTLSHILVEKENGRLTTPALVIAPTSLMFNWEQESKRFSPDLRVLVLQGASRKSYFENLADYDLILTTYPLILRDKDVLLSQSFHLLILDEAQYIKNKKSLSTQIVMQLKATHRLCLTGTPMENHLGELWSLFHFLMPGLLGDERTFATRFRTPIEKHADEERRAILSRRIAPFLLRRTKAVVAKELPPKVEMVSYVELEDDQRDLYETIRIAMQEKVKDEVAKLGFARSQIVILDALLKLRQVCCDPALLKSETRKKQISSCKINLLKEMLPELIEDGRRILIFSSFVQMLDIIENLVQELGIAYVRLTGETKDRKTPIDRFQKEEVPLFLISLKAGGTGLNLTAADTVIHIDPWWNPAAENQATDRAYRIGQDKTVFVYKIVTKGTVEEKILAMQAKKQSLSDSILSDKQVEKTKLTESDLQVLFSAI